MVKGVGSMNDAGQTAVEAALKAYDNHLLSTYVWTDGAREKADALWSVLREAVVREADPRREAVDTALEAALDLFNWQAADRGNGLWCGDDFATGDVGADGRQVYVECNYEHQCGDCTRLNALDTALKAVEQASLSDTEEGGRA